MTVSLHCLFSTSVSWLHTDLTQWDVHCCSVESPQCSGDVWCNGSYSAHPQAGRPKCTRLLEAWWDIFVLQRTYTHTHTHEHTATVDYIPPSELFWLCSGIEGSEGDFYFVQKQNELRLCGGKTRSKWGWFTLVDKREKWVFALFLSI